MKGVCEYCGERPARHTDHFIKKGQAKRMIRAAQERENPRYKAAACYDCNMQLYTRNRVPVGYEHLIPELEAITGGVYATWSGDVAELREVIR